jgi:hypothetical protein
VYDESPVVCICPRYNSCTAQQLAFYTTKAISPRKNDIQLYKLPSHFLAEVNPSHIAKPSASTCCQSDVVSYVNSLTLTRQD